VGNVTEATRTADGAAGPSVDVEAVGARIAANIGRVIQGKDDVVRLALVVLLAEGHLLIEDVPGVGKTTLAKALSSSIDATVRRIQFTPDLLPSDVTGVAIYDQETRAFEFKPGAVFANVVVADEINRASPKTQSALLECMEERQVTVDGVSYELARPFIVMATQNPLEMEGTYPLPEAQRDRFTARVSMGYPGRDAEVAMLDGRTTTDPLSTLAPVADAATAARRDRAPGVEGRWVASGEDLVAAARSAVEVYRRWYGDTMGVEARAWLARVEAEAARMRGEPGVDPWRAALEGFGFGHVYEQARSRWRLAEALLATDERVAAAAEARAAHEVAARLGAVPLKTAVEALARRGRLDAGLPGVRLAEVSDVLTPREAEVLGLLAQGRTNRQIGSALYISEKTASVHVSNLVAKLGASGRTEAVAIAAARGLLSA